MNRRSFLRVVGMAPVAAVALPGAAAVGAAFDPSWNAPVPSTPYPYGKLRSGCVVGGGDPMTPEFRLAEAREAVARLERTLGISQDDFDGEQA